MNELIAARVAKIGFPQKAKLPKYIYKNFHGSTFRVQIRNRYIGTFSTVEAAQACIDEIFAQKEKPAECVTQQA